MNDLSAFCPYLVLPDKLGRLPAPHPRRLLAAKEVAWEDLAWLEGKMFGSLSKKGREIESDTWQGPPPGSTLGRLLTHWPGSSRPAPRRGSGRGQKWVRRGTVLGMGGGQAARG